MVQWFDWGAIPEDVSPYVAYRKKRKNHIVCICVVEVYFETYTGVF